MFRDSSRYPLKATGPGGFGAYKWLPQEEPCFVYATRPCTNRWQCHKPPGDCRDWHQHIENTMEFFVVCCLYGAAEHDETHPERVKRLEFHWHAVSWGIFDRIIGQYVMSGGPLILLWNVMSLKRDRMVIGVRKALKRMIHRGWITKSVATTHQFGDIALYAPTQALIELLRAK